MPVNFEVRQSTIGDLNEVAEIFNQYRIFYGQDSDVERARQFLFDRYEHRESIIFIVQDVLQKRLAGFTQLYPVFSSISLERSYLLNDLYVQEEYRKQGVGHLLLEAARDYTAQMRGKGLELATALDNERAQRLYEQHGFVKDEEYLHYFLKV
ncbi:GNAT family N-acetyltransferase [Paenibacillus lutrae]|uniref:GNAT family N-acetyltransferase n=1 Tax=Paenibacillus lutrae TaxID=2078573 RepID=A0A7X3FMT4_9BACL|nr:GNAT family N-acetyltransferase [Paenibacillus lutrae]MVP02596.1 GNAT family N-acetyltransferase [Paenibacillus lutrae]